MKYLSDMFKEAYSPRPSPKEAELWDRIFKLEEDLAFATRQRERSRFLVARLRWEIKDIRASFNK